MFLRVFASGSKGNCLAVRSEGGGTLLVDCGLSCRELHRRARECGESLARVDAVLFTHDHSDHIAGLATFRKRYPEAGLYANGDTADAISAKTGVRDGWTVFETATSFEAAGFVVTSFSVSHDAADPVGFLIEDPAAEGRSALFVGTDTGVATAGFVDAFARATCAVLESNHDPVLLAQSARPQVLKQRIAGRSGHLSNEDAAEVVRAAASSLPRCILLAHLSEECNTPSLALHAVKCACGAAGCAQPCILALEQHRPSGLFAV